MRIAMALRFSAAEHRVLNRRLPARRRMFQRSLPILAAAIAACGLAGCGSDVIDSEHARRISRERIALLKQQPAPKCDYRPASLDDSGKRQSGDPPPSSEAGSNPDAVVRMKLDYERQCYRRRDDSPQTAHQPAGCSPGHCEGCQPQQRQQPGTLSFRCQVIPASQ
jgi:hypothetical protein